MSKLIIQRYDLAAGLWKVDQYEIDTEATIIIPATAPAGAEEPPLRVVRVLQACNVRNAPDKSPSTDVGDLAAGKMVNVIGEDGEWWVARLYVHKTMVEEI